MTYNEKTKEYRYKYEREKLKRIPLDVQISEYQDIKQAADKAGQSVNGFIKQAIRDRINSINIETSE